MKSLNDKVFAVDPGTVESGWVVLSRDLTILQKGKSENIVLLRKILPCLGLKYPDARLVIEDMQSFGKPVGNEVFKTAQFSGRIAEAWFNLRGQEAVFQKTTLMRRYITGFSKGGKDSDVRRGIMDIYANETGYLEDTALIGKKKAPGPLFGVVNDIWLALGHAITFFRYCG